jgi:octaprenyl-diphosphate synthase
MLGLAAENFAATERGQSEFSGAVGALHSLLAEDLSAVHAAIVERTQSPVEIIPAVAGHLLGAGGKRVRPMLTLAAARAFGYAGMEHIKLAAAVELIHGATLLHDDVVDKSSLRRGAATANTIWGNKESVLVGDFVFSRAFELMVAAGNLKVLRILSAASGIIAEGEVLQLATQKNLGATLQMYLSVVEAKTAALFAAAAHSGAVIANAPSEAESGLRNFGANFGIAYQLVDDALDYAGAETALGKRIGDDFREGKMTLPVVYAAERATAAERSFWTRTIAEGRQHPGDFAAACEILDRTKAVEATMQCARRYAGRALEELHSVPANSYSAALAELAETSVDRRF